MQYGKIRNILMLVFLTTVFAAAEEVLPLVPYDGTEASYLGVQIIADTTANNGILPGRVYELERGGIYLAKTQLSMVDPGETLHLRAADGDGPKPIIYLYPTGTGDNPERPPGYFIRTQGGDLIMKDIALTGYFEPLPANFDNIQGGMLRNDVAGSSFIIDGCIFSNTRGQVLRTNQNTITTSFTNCVFANLGSLVGSNLGAGKGIDLRDKECVQFILENNTFVNYQDRPVRHYNFGDPGAGTGLIHSGRINHNTFINGMGYHGLLSLGSVGAEMTITNNLFVDAFGLGEDSTDASRAAEWANTGETYANGNNKITWIFTSPNDVTDWTVSNNYWTVSDSGQAFLDDFDFGYADPLSQHIKDRIGAAAAADAFSKIDLDLAEIPPMMTNMMRWYEDPLGGDKSKNTPCECFDPETDDMHRRSILWLRDTLDASYSTGSAAYTGAENGLPVGDLNWFPDKKAEWISPAEAVLPLVPYDGTEASYLGVQIIADTTANNGILPGRVYELERGGIYLAKTQLSMVDPEETLHLRAADGDGPKPIIYLYPTGTGDNPERPPGYFIRTQGGDLIMKDIALTGYFEPIPANFDNIQGGMLRNDVAGSSFIIDGCIFSNTRGQVLRTNQNTITTSFTNCVFANLGSLVGSNLGAGKGIDLRDKECVQFILENNTFVNYQDRPVRHYNFGDPGAGTGLIHSGYINQNTFINGMGYHGLLSLGSVGAEMTITNNLFVDAFGLGEDSTDASRAAEWANTGETYANGNNKISWIFTSPNDVTDWTVSNNYWTVSDSGQAFLDDFDFGYADPLSQHIKDRIGAAAADAFSKIDLDLAEIPPMMTNMMRWYEDPLGGDKSKNTPCECFDPETDDMHRRSILWLRDTLDASYSTGSAAYTGSTIGGPVGDLNWFGLAVGLQEISKQQPASFVLRQNYPNPFNPSTRIDFQITKPDKVTLQVYNVLGQKVATLINKKLTAGSYSIDWNASNFTSGIYFYKLSQSGFVKTKKMILVK